MRRPTTLRAAALGAALALLPAVGAAQRYTPGVGGARVLQVLADVATTQRLGRYTHDTRIDVRAGRYEWDCSAMAAWVLRRAAPETVRAIAAQRPLAVDFYRAIARSPAAPTRAPWQRIARVQDARPGDVFAWQRPRWFPSHNTGHVGFVVGVPEVTPRGVLLRIADATSHGHEDDPRDGATRTGFGYGTLLIATDAQGAGTAYGWIGRDTPDEWMIPTPVVIGRPQR
jgi:hypothetical protein